MERDEVEEEEEEEEAEEFDLQPEHNNMAANSSSNDSLLHANSTLSMYCFFTKQNSLIFYMFSVTTILLFLPLFILVLYLGFQRSSSSSAVMSHTDSFTYHLTSIELIGVLGFIISCCAVYWKQVSVFKLGFFLMNVTWSGQLFFHMLTCVERYLAVVHPVTYLGLRRERGVRIRTVSVGCVWLLCFGMAAIEISLDFTWLSLCLLIFSVIVISFCSLSVLYILIRPGPGEQGGDRERVDQSKRRAFYTIMAILGVLLLRCGVDMTVNSSSSNNSSNNSMDCLFIKPHSLIFYIFSITTILLFVPLFVFVLYLGFQRWRQQRSSSSSAVMSHTDSFTYHLTSIELIGVLGFIISCCAVYLKQLPVLMWGWSLLTFTWYGQTFFHMLTCVERYLAVVHPVTYLGLRRERGVRIRTVSVGLSVLCILIRPGPGEQGGGRVDQSKQRAFYTIMAILAVLVLRGSVGTGEREREQSRGTVCGLLK
ncbi:hypothetical protein EYF80_054436 [Liparis tanakae]|uniref:G-protein coupled receptors family 1 profile domain-containing protein n=1 Tax=Liparis tanakae TaxID=230148 RepID=A0A4Z2F3E1_9TELE|nr:hypothetical protein EYF80_054436 [Liparis tanakae]